MMIINFTSEEMIILGLFSMCFWMLAGYFLRMIDEKINKWRKKRNDRKRMPQV